jgi:hypothetical protein
MAAVCEAAFAGRDDKPDATMIGDRIRLSGMIEHFNS